MVYESNEDGIYDLNSGLPQICDVDDFNVKYVCGDF